MKPDSKIAKHFMLFNTATETVSWDEWMTEAERMRRNLELVNLDSDSRWIPYLNPDAE